MLRSLINRLPAFVVLCLSASSCFFFFSDIAWLKVVGWDEGITSLWGGCSSSPFYDSYRPKFETWVRIRYFRALSIRGPTARSSSDLRGSTGFRRALGSATCEQLTSYLPAADELLTGSSRATCRQLTSDFRATCWQLTSCLPAAHELLPSTHKLLSSSSRATSEHSQATSEPLTATCGAANALKLPPKPRTPSLQAL